MTKTLSSLSDLAAAFGKAPIDENSKTTKPDNDNLVYSTKSGKIKSEKKQVITPSDGFAKVRRETKGRKGKGVTTISGLGLNQTELKKLASQLKKVCGTGGSVVDETIEIQGDKKQEVKSVLEKQGFKVKFIGG